jgi:hypothetical protein
MGWGCRYCSAPNLARWIREDGYTVVPFLYTTRDANTPAVASGIVLASTHLPAGPRPIIAWAHGTTGYAPRCAPSLATDPFTAGALPALIRRTQDRLAGTPQPSGCHTISS